jgi:glycosyltransferase involved in cell wall biosynthesis
VLASFGQWSELKGTDLLFEALGRLGDPRRVRLLLAGGAPFPDFAARVEQLAADCPVDVRLLGPYDHADLASHPVADAHLFVTATRAHESWGLVVDEALELGQGVLLPDLGALGERARAVAEDPWAALFRSADPDDLARLLEQLLDDPARVAALGAGATRAVEAGDLAGRALPVEEVARRHLELYRAALAEGPAAVEPADPAAEAEALERLAAWDRQLAGHSPEELGLA